MEKIFRKHDSLQVALEKYRTGMISTGKACELAGVDRYTFMEACRQHGIPVLTFPPEELEVELKILGVPAVYNGSMTRADMDKLLALSAEDRLHLAEALWDSLEGEQDVVPISAAQRELLDRRLEAYRAEPDDLLTWSEVRAKLARRA